MRWWISLVVCASAAAGPVDFGFADVQAALASRHLKIKIDYELSLEPSETFRIEPYKAGGAHITGGDLRGLMYGLLEAAEQVRSTGRLAQTHGVPALGLRGVRVFARVSDLGKYSQDFWRGYFEMLARDRFNHFTLVFARENALPALAESSAGLRFILQAATDYGIDFTLGLWQPPIDGDTLGKLLTACPLLRTVQIFDSAADFDLYREHVFKTLRKTGHRVALDPLGSLTRPAFLKAAEEAGVALLPPPSLRPGGFEIDPPGAPEFERRSFFYWLWGRLGYDPKAKLSRTEKPDDYLAAGRIINLLAAAHLSNETMYTWPAANAGVSIFSYADPGSADWGGVATISEAVRSRVEGIASAKQTPLETADGLIAAAADLDRASHADFQLLTELARYHAHKQRAAYDLLLFDRTKDLAALDRAEQELNEALGVWRSLERIAGEGEGSLEDLLDVRLDLEAVARRRQDQASPALAIPPLAKPLPKPQIVHLPVRTARPDAPLTLTLQITPPKDARTIRLHYRALNPAAPPSKTMDEPASSSVSFTIPASDLPASGDFAYYFEILNQEKSGWFEPESLVAAPFHVVRIAIPN